MSIRKGVSWTFLGYAVWSACNFLMGVLLTKMGGPHGKEMVGIYGTANGLSQPFMQLGAFGLTSIYAARAGDKYRFEEFFGLRIFALIIGTFLLAGWTWIEFPGSGYMMVITLIFMGGCICDRTAEMLFTLYQREGVLQNLGISQIIRGVLSLILFCVGFFVGHGVLGAVLGSALASVFMIFFWDWPRASRLFRSLPQGELTRRLIRPVFSMKTYLGIGSLALPIALSVFIDSFALQLPRTHLAQFPNGREMAGQLTAYMYAIVIGSLMVQAVSTTIAPRLGLHWNQGNINEYKRVLLMGFALILSLGIALPFAAYWFGRPVLAVLFNKTLAGDPMTFAMVGLAGGLGFLASLIGTALTAAKTLKFQGFWMVPGLIVSVAGSYWLIGRYFILGAGITLVAIALVKTILGAVVLLRTIRLKEKDINSSGSAAGAAV